MENTINKNKLVLIVVFCLLILLGLIIYNYRNPSNDGYVIDNEDKVKLLNDYSRFFTVNSCIYKYVTYIQNKDVDSLLKVLNNDYVENNGINQNNVLSYVDNLNGNYSFVSKKIYYEEISDNYIKYYVYGYLIEDTIDGYGEKVDKYYIVSFDKNNYTFDLAPYDKNSFEEVINE